MPYSRAWNESTPTGADLANQLDTIIQNTKTDFRERLAGIFGMNLGEFSADPIAPKTLTLSGALAAASLSGPLTGTIQTAAQPNITSLGTLTGLNVSGTFQTAGGVIVGQESANNNLNLSYGNAAGLINFRNQAGTVIFTMGGGALYPGTDNTYNLGVAGTQRFANVYALTFTGALVGNASTSTTLQTARNINGVSFNGSADITVPAAAGTLTGATLAAGVTGSSLTSVGVLTALSIAGALTFTAAVGKIIPGATSISFRNNVDGADNLIITDAGAVTVRNGLTVSSGDVTITTGNLVLSGAAAVVRINGNNIIGPRQAGWATATGPTFSRTAIVDGDSLATTVAHLAALVNDLRGHGLI